MKSFYKLLIAASLAVIVVGASGCKNPLGPKMHHVVAINPSDFNVQWAVTRTPFSGDPPANCEWIDIGYEDAGYVDRASMYLEEGTYYASARYKADGKIYLRCKEFRLDSDHQDIDFEGHLVAAVMNVAPGRWSYRTSLQPVGDNPMP